MQGLTAQDAQSIHDAAESARAQLQPGSPEAEAESDALLAANHAWSEGAHSERPSTKWNRKHSRCVTHDPIREANRIDQYIESSEIIIAASAGLSDTEYMVWHFVDQEGVSQSRVATAMGVSQRTVSRILMNAREELKYLVDANAKRIFRVESHRTAYFAPQYRPNLPLGVEEAREEMERTPEISTHIMPDDLGFVEVWKGGKRQVEIGPDDKEKPIGKHVSSLRTRVKCSRRARRVKLQAKKVASEMQIPG